MVVKTDRDKPLDTAVAALLLVTAVMLAVRMLAARTVGFGDSEALYATYAMRDVAKGLQGEVQPQVSKAAWDKFMLRSTSTVRANPFRLRR